MLDIDPIVYASGQLPYPDEDLATSGRGQRRCGGR
jgi:hypothetical protein